MRKTFVVLIACLTSVLILPLSLANQAQASDSPSWPFGSSCKSNEVGRTKSNNSQVCVKSGNSYKWVKVLSKKDVYSLSSFCSTTIKSESSGAVCGWNEKLGVFLASKFAPRDICIDALRQVVYMESPYYVTGGYVDTGFITESVYKILETNGCFTRK